jgi:cobalt-zinc-cadmium efflux system membrane fusion protein
MRTWLHRLLSGGTTRAAITAIAGGAGLLGLVLSTGGCSDKAESVASANAKVASPPESGPQTLKVSEAALTKNPITLAAATRMRIAPDLQVVGSVSYNQNHYAIVGPLVSGRVSRLLAGLGDTVRSGQVLAELESSDIGQAQAAYLSAKARVTAAQANLKRERDLAEQKISSVREREMAEAQAISEEAELRAASERLRAYGFSQADIGAMNREGRSTDNLGGKVSLRAPIPGTVVARHITLGQAVERATDAFKIIDLTQLWVLLDIYEKDLQRVYVGQKVELRTETYPGEVFHARVAHVSPLIDEKTRTANILIEFDNPKGKMRPGQFVTARILGDKRQASVEVLAVPRRAVTSVEGKSVLFVRTKDGFQRRIVETGLSDPDHTEIKKGVTDGEMVATDGAFLLKSELLR